MYLGFLLCVITFWHCHSPLCSFFAYINPFDHKPMWLLPSPALKLAKPFLDYRLLALCSRRLNLLNCTYCTCVFNTLFLPSFLLFPLTLLYMNSPFNFPQTPSLVILSAVDNQAVHRDRLESGRSSHWTSGQTTKFLYTVANHKTEFKKKIQKTVPVYWGPDLKLTCRHFS